MSPKGALPFDPVAEARRQWEGHGWADAAPGMAAVTSITRVQQVLQHRVDAVLHTFDLTFARFEVLQLLAFSRKGELPLGRMSVRLQVHPASVTSAVDRLQRQGFVARMPHPTDGRTTLAHITAGGRRVAEQATARLNDEVFADLGLSDRELDQLFELLRKIRQAAGDFA